MSEITIRVEGLSKQYQIPGRSGSNARFGYRTLRDSLTQTMLAPLQKLTSGRLSNDENAASNPAFWALQDISFTITRGEVIGVIGRNGAGKSTLLKILSRITAPTKGEVQLVGRVSSLLEVGTGFHPELSGRENIFLNGAILGMKRAEIRHKFDEMVAFAEVEPFIDMPVKHYSSGMYMRLAFAVAAQLEPEILLVDEVLAVGDVEFQQKCLGKMEDIAKEGRTVLFVSHNLGAIRTLCPRAFLLQQGRLVQTGPVDEVIGAYLAQLRHQQARVTIPAPTTPTVVTMECAEVTDHAGHPCTELDYNLPFGLTVEFAVHQPVHALSVWVRLVNQQGIYVMLAWVGYQIACEVGRYRATCQAPAQFLTPGPYYLDVGSENFPVEIYHNVYRCLSFEVLNTAPDYLPGPHGWGVTHLQLPSQVVKVD